MKLQLYKSFVLPHLHYCASIIPIIEFYERSNKKSGLRNTLDKFKEIYFGSLKSTI